MSKLFLCHSSVDKPFVRRLADDLNRQHVNVWIDEKEILVGDPIRQKIEEGLKESDYLAIVLSPESVASAWVQKELDAKLIEEIESKKVFVLPLLHRNCDVPLFLKGKHYADFRRDYDAGLTEVLARLRRSNDRENEVKAKILARLSTTEPQQIDSHLLMQLLAQSRQVELVDELLDAHELKHPNCPQVRGTRMIARLLSFQSNPTADSYSEALKLAVDVCIAQPQPGHFQNVEQLTQRPFKDPRVLQSLLRLLDDLKQTKTTDKNPMIVGVMGCLLSAAHEQSRTEEDNEKIYETALSVISDSKKEHLVRVIGPLVHLLAHMIETSKFGSKPKRFARLVEVATPKISNSGDSADAFLHMAWVCAKNDETDNAKSWLEKFKLSVPTDHFQKSVKGHHPLSDLVDQI